MDDQTFETVDRFALDATEQVQTSCNAGFFMVCCVICMVDTRMGR